MSEKRRFSRIKCVEKCSVETGSGTIEVDLLDISLKGALVEHPPGLAAGPGDSWKLSFRLNQSEIVLRFDARVVHCRGNLAGVKFVEMDLDTMVHLRSLMEARTADPDQVREELGFFVDSD